MGIVRSVTALLCPFRLESHGGRRNTNPAASMRTVTCTTIGQGRVTAWLYVCAMPLALWTTAASNLTAAILFRSFTRRPGPDCESREHGERLPKRLLPAAGASRARPSRVIFGPLKPWQSDGIAMVRAAVEPLVFSLPPLGSRSDWRGHFQPDGGITVIFASWHLGPWGLGASHAFNNL